MNRFYPAHGDFLTILWTRKARSTIKQETCRWENPLYFPRGTFLYNTFLNGVIQWSLRPTPSNCTFYQLITKQKETCHRSSFINVTRVTPLVCHSFYPQLSWWTGNTHGPCEPGESKDQATEEWLLICRWLVGPAAVSVMSSLSWWGTETRTAPDWFSAVFHFYHYYWGCQDAKAPDATAVYTGLMNLLAQTCILLLLLYTTGILVQMKWAQIHH